MLLQYNRLTERIKQVEDPDVRGLIRIATTVLVIPGNGFVNRPEPIDLIAFVDAMEIVFSKQHVLEAAVEGRLDDLRWWPEDDE